MNKKILFVLIAGSLTLAGCSQSAQENESTDDPTSDPAITENNEKEATSMQGKIEEIDADWNRYTNRDLGFSMEYPKVDFFNKSNTEILEDGNVVYILDEKNEEEIEQKKGLSYIERARFSVLIQDVDNDEQLDHFIKEQYGENCKLGEKKESNKEGVFDVSIDGPVSMDDPESCLIKVFTLIKYSPEKGKVAAWSIGPLYMDIASGFDDHMIDSFVFL